MSKASSVNKRIDPIRSQTGGDIPARDIQAQDIQIDVDDKVDVVKESSKPKERIQSAAPKRTINKASNSQSQPSKSKDILNSPSKDSIHTTQQPDKQPVQAILQPIHINLKSESHLQNSPTEKNVLSQPKITKQNDRTQPRLDDNEQHSKEDPSGRQGTIRQSLKAPKQSMENQDTPPRSKHGEGFGDITRVDLPTNLSQSPYLQTN